MICHGIPDNRPLEDGDICNIDVSCYYEGYHSDVNETLLIGNVSEVLLSFSIDLMKSRNRSILYKRLMNVLNLQLQLASQASFIVTLVPFSFLLNVFIDDFRQYYSGPCIKEQI